MKKPTSGKRILLVSHEMTYTGAPRSLLNLAKILSALNNSVDVLTLSNGNFQKEYEAAGYSVRLLQPPWDDFIPDLKKYDLVIANTVFCLHFAHFAQGYAEVILFLREAQNIHDIAVNCGIHDLLLREIKRIVCVSEYARDYIEQFYHISGIKVLHNYIPDVYRHKLNFSRDKKVHFMVSGTVEERKQQKTVIDAFRLIPDDLRKKCVLHIVGNNPDWSRYYWETFLPVKDKNIIFHGEISDEKERIALYERMNVFIVASTDEACSLVALEGAMLGKAVIMSDHVGAQYLFGADRRFIFSVGNEKELAWKMRQLTSRKELLLEGIRMKNAYGTFSSKKIYIDRIKKLIDQI